MGSVEEHGESRTRCVGEGDKIRWCRALLGEWKALDFIANALGRSGAIIRFFIISKFSFVLSKHVTRFL